MSIGDVVAGRESCSGKLGGSANDVADPLELDACSRCSPSRSLSPLSSLRFLLLSPLRFFFFCFDKSFTDFESVALGKIGKRISW